MPVTALLSSTSSILTEQSFSEDVFSACQDVHARMSALSFATERPSPGARGQYSVARQVQDFDFRIPVQCVVRQWIHVHTSVPEVSDNFHIFRSWLRKMFPYSCIARFDSGYMFTRELCRLQGVRLALEPLRHPKPRMGIFFGPDGPHLEGVGFEICTLISGLPHSDGKWNQDA